jgi:hypothetical protein
LIHASRQISDEVVGVGHSVIGFLGIAFRMCGRHIESRHLL